MTLDKETTNIILNIITKNEESLRRLQEQQKKQSQILDGIISTTDDLMKDVKNLKGDL
tara:strand:- start:830 stop:1003 length:174 start_codon:yes stop_codon:yes gene_type:complete